MFFFLFAADLQLLRVLRFEDPALGPRRMPLFQDYQTGKVELEEGKFSVDAEKREVKICMDNGKNVNIGTDLVYVIA